MVVVGGGGGGGRREEWETASLARETAPLAANEGEDGPLASLQLRVVASDRAGGWYVRHD